MAKVSSQVIGTVKKYQNSIAIKKHNAIVRAWAAPCARDVAAVFWSTWKDIESRIPTSADGDFREADRQMTAAEKRALKNKYTAATRAAVNAASPQLERVLRYYEEKVFLAGLVEHARSLECLHWMFSLRTNRHVKEEGKFAEADNLNISGAFSLPNYRAQKYARDHAAEAVTRINSTTRKEIARIVQQGVENGTSYGDIADAIRSKFKDFAVPQPQKHIANRGVLVAVTELANAYCEANLQTAGMLQQSGVQMMKAWQTLEDDRVSDGCEANQSAGWIPLDREFPSGHMRPPRFPGCRCDMLTEMMVPGAIGRSIDWYFDHEDELWTDVSTESLREKKSGDVLLENPDLAQGLWDALRDDDNPSAAIEYLVKNNGYDGLPKLIDASELREDALYRGVSAESNDTLSKYKDDLRNGDWYYSARVGGSDYGKGMYTSDKRTGAEEYANAMSHSTVEEMQLQSGARVLDPTRDIGIRNTKAWREEQYKKYPEFFRQLYRAACDEEDSDFRWNSQSDYREFLEYTIPAQFDWSTWGVLLGYDATRFSSFTPGEHYYVILNRTALEVVR